MPRDGIWWGRMGYYGKWLARLACLAVLGCASLHAQELQLRRTDFGASYASADVQYVAQWALDSADNRRQPYAVVDKRDARIYVFSAEGQLVGSSSVLLGLTPGDAVVGDPSRLQPSELRQSQRTTPAGRFASEPGHNLSGEDIVWLDYANKLAIHRVRPGETEMQRLQRLASASADDKRVSAGCVVVPVAFYETVIRNTLGRGRGVVYVMPETRPVREVFNTADPRRAATLAVR